MIQFAVNPHSPVAPLDQIRQALDQGMGWIRVTTTATDAADAEPLCREKEAFLVLDNDVDAVEKLRIHGVHLTSWDRGSVIAAREKLGAHAIVGVSFAPETDPAELRGLDIDYALIPGIIPGLPEKIRAVNADCHPVAADCYPAIPIDTITAAGYDGAEFMLPA